MWDVEYHTPLASATVISCGRVRSFTTLITALRTSGWVHTLVLYNLEYATRLGLIITESPQAISLRPPAISMACWTASCIEFFRTIPTRALPLGGGTGGSIMEGLHWDGPRDNASPARAKPEDFKKQRRFI